MSTVEMTQHVAKQSKQIHIVQKIFTYLSPNLPEYQPLAAASSNTPITSSESEFPSISALQSQYLVHCSTMGIYLLQGP